MLMEPLTFLAVAIGVTGLSIFNYYLNLAPGSEPEDFNVASEIPIRCDCFLSTIILGGIAALCVAISSFAFTREELYAVGIAAFAIVTAAGIVGRRRRHMMWDEMHGVFRRAVRFERARPNDDEMWEDIDLDDEGVSDDLDPEDS